MIFEKPGEYTVLVDSKRIFDVILTPLALVEYSVAFNMWAWILPPEFLSLLCGSLVKGFTAETESESMAAARSARRQRKLDQIEIPEDDVVVTDELLGKGGFGDVFLADINGRNAAAKVLHHR